MKLKSLKIQEDLHEQLRTVCFDARLSIFAFVDDTLRRGCTPELARKLKSRIAAKMKEGK